MKQTIIILHGWGLSGAKYNQLSKLLEREGYKVFSPDLPGFGLEPLKSKSMDLDDYVNFVDNLIKKNKIEKPMFIGHSFGGRVCLKYGWKYPEKVSKIFLTGTPVIRNRSFKKKVAYLIAKTGGKAMKISPEKAQHIFKKILYRFIGEWDYYKAGPLTQVFKNIIQEDLIKYFKEVKVPVFLIWGDKDMITPSKDIEKMNKIRPDIKSVIVTGIGHKLPYEKPEDFYKEVKKFI